MTTEAPQLAASDSTTAEIAKAVPKTVDALTGLSDSVGGGGYGLTAVVVICVSVVIIVIAGVWYRGRKLKSYTEIEKAKVRRR